MRGLTGIRIGNYTIQHRLRQGSMAEVYCAQDSRTGQMVVIKLVDRRHMENYQRLLREIEVGAMVQHSHILPILDQSQYGTWCYTVTPYIASGTLDERLALCPLSCQEAELILQQLTGTLQFTHNRGIVHRDIKPANVLLENEYYVYIVDFGLARKVGEYHSTSRSGFTMGTPIYMAPELLGDHYVAATSDIYALGILLYEMLTGRTPFEGVTVDEIIQKHMYALPAPPSAINPTIPDSVDRVILRALEKDPARRFQNATDLFLSYQCALAVGEQRPGRGTEPVGFISLPETDGKASSLRRWRGPSPLKRAIVALGLE